MSKTVNHLYQTVIELLIKLHKLESSVGYFCEPWSDLFIL